MIIILAPDYDEITRYTRKWITEASWYPEQVLHVSAGAIRADDLRKILELHQRKRKVFVFAGHGFEAGLLGAPSDNHDDVIVEGDRHSVLYHSQSSTSFDDSMFAFACDCGDSLGKEFGRVQEQGFLGYTRKIPLNYVNYECEQAWVMLLQRIAESISARTRVVEEHRQELSIAYRDTLNYFRNGPGRRNDQSLLMQAYLLRHRKSLTWRS